MAGESVIKNSDLVRSILDQACARREFLILVTPYLRFESHFLALEDGVLHVSATMSREDALYGLRTADLHLRFPHGATFMDGPTRMIGLGLVEGRKSLKLTPPKQLNENEQRKAFRVDRVGRVTATVSTRKFDLWTATLVNLSLTGARLQAPRDLHPEVLSPGDELTVTIPLTDEIRLNVDATVRHLDTRTFGLQFLEALPEPTQTLLARWIFQKREEDKDRVTRRGVDLAPAQAVFVGGSGAKAPGGLLLVSSSAILEAELEEVLRDTQPLTRVPPHGQGLKEGLRSHPMLVFFHVASLGLDERRRLKTLVEGVSGKMPFMMLGTPEVDMSPLLELGTELKAAATYQWQPGRGAFFQRLVQGILRRHYEDREGPLVPQGEG